MATEALLIDVFDLENSPLAKIQFIGDFFACTGPLMDHHTMQANEELLTFLDGSNYDHYIYSTDALGIALGNSNLSQETKSRMLPVRNQDYFLLAGTQIALSRATKRLNIKAPIFKVGNTIQELELLLATWPSEAIAKVDHDGGGARVRQVPCKPQGQPGKDRPKLVSTIGAGEYNRG